MRSVTALFMILALLLAAGCGREDKSTPPTSSMLPANAASFHAAAVGWDYLILEWTAPEGEDGRGYDLRIASDELTEATWETATRVDAVPPVGAAGAVQSMMITTLSPSSSYWIGLRVRDLEGRISDLQAVLHVTTRARPAPSPLIEIPPGRFVMGSDPEDSGLEDEAPETILDLGAFAVEPTEVTNAQYAIFMEEGGYGRLELWSEAGWEWRQNAGVTHPLYWDSGVYRTGLAWPDFPVSGVSWYEASAYARWAGRRLPTEAEWEKAARGGCLGTEGCQASNERTYPWGEGIEESRGNSIDSNDPYEPGPTPVGFYDGSVRDGYATIDGRSPYGIHDLSGNVVEWTASLYAPYPYLATDGREEADSPGRRVARGGGWENEMSHVRCAVRNHAEPWHQVPFFGFRCAQDR